MKIKPAATRIVASIIAGILVLVFEILVPSTASMHFVIAILVFEAWLLSELFIEIAIRETTTDQSIQELRKLLIEKVPNLEALRVLASHEEADLYLTEVLGDASFVRNTRIPTGTGMDDFSQKRADDAFRNAIPEFLADKNCILRELIADYPSLVGESRRIQSEATGLYEFCTWRNPPAVFMNFVIIEFKDIMRPSEVIVGWAVAAGLAFDTHSFILTEPSVHKFYSGLFEALWNSGLHDAGEMEPSKSDPEPATDERST